MAVSYNRLWKLLIDRNMTKTDLAEDSKVSIPTISRMKQGKHVSTEQLEKICRTLNCKVHEIIEFVDDDINNNKN